jgi:hypothetical protein
VSPLVQWILVALGALGAAGTWLRAITAWQEHRAAERAITAWKEHRAAERERRRFEEGR